MVERFMKYAEKKNSGAMICIPIFIDIGSGIQNLIRKEMDVKENYINDI
jgi:hypothetical protein